jgi:2-iminobutanoate/2-iminopropanoate deaminase
MLSALQQEFSAVKSLIFAVGLVLLSTTVMAAVPVTHFPATDAMLLNRPMPRPAPPFSAAVMAGDTLYIAGATDTDRATGTSPADPKAGAKLVLDIIKGRVEAAGLTMNNLVWVQVFCSDLAYYAAFNEVYTTYFTGPMPARAFIGSGSLLAGAHFEVMGIAVRSK